MIKDLINEQTKKRKTKLKHKDVLEKDKFKLLENSPYKKLLAKGDKLKSSLLSPPQSEHDLSVSEEVANALDRLSSRKDVPDEEKIFKV